MSVADDRIVRAYRRLLSLYPPDFRARFGDELEATFRSAWRAARAGGRGRVLRFLIGAAGDLVRTALAERRGVARRGMGSGWTQDVRHGLRGLRRRPGFSAAVIVTVALGVGANAAVFSLVDAVLLDPVRVRDPATLVAIYEARENDPYGATSWPTYRELAEDLRTLSGLAVSSELDVSLKVGDVTGQASAGVVSGNWFEVLGLVPQVGRLLLPADEEGGGSYNVVLSDGLWRRRFGADRAVIGRAVELSGQTFTIVGVAPPGFRGVDLTAAHDLWIPVVLIRSVGGDGLWGADVLNTRFLPFLRMVGRMRPDASPAEVAAELNTRHAALREIQGAEMDLPFADPVIRALPIRSAVTAERRGDIVRFLMVPGIVAALTLAIACMNVALLLLVRASERQQEFGIRTALGAPRSRLARQVLLESVLIGVAGAAVGLAVAQVTIALLQRFPLPGGIVMETLDLAPDARMLGFGLSVSLLTALLFGSVPAWAVGRSDIASLLRRRASNVRGEGGTMRTLLLAGQVALCLTLLVGAGLFLRSVEAALAVEPGFDAQGVAAASFSLRPHGYTRESAPIFFQSVIAQVAAAPGVESAALGVHVPIEPRRLRMPISNEVIPQGTGSFGPGGFFLPVNIVAGDWFRVLRIRVLSGRVFGPADGPNAPQVVVLSRSAAEELWPGRNPIGRQIQLVRGIGEGLTVIGVVEDITAHAVQEGAVPYVYVSALQNPQVQALSNATLIARDGSGGTRAREAIRSALAREDPSLPVVRERLVEDQIAGVLVPQRLGTTLLGIFGIVALLVAAAGIYGVVAYAVSRRRFEIGLRRALGASRADVVRSVTRQTAIAIVGGTLAGLAGAAWLTRFVEAWLFGIPPIDPPAYLGAAGLLALASLAATWIPAHRALRVSPLTALRSD